MTWFRTAITCATVAVSLAPAGALGQGVRSPPAISRVAATGPAQLVFTPVPTCRVLDTRINNAPLSANTQRGFYVGGTINFPAQGGTRGGCGVPAYAVAAALSLTSYNSTAAGSLAVAPVGTPPEGVAVSFQKGVPTTAGTTVGLGPSENIYIKAVSAATHVAADVTGYYARQITGTIAADGTLYATSGAVLSSSKSQTGSYIAIVERDVTFCTVTANSPYLGPAFYATGETFSGPRVYLEVWRIVSGVPTRLDAYVSFTVTC